MLPDPVGSLPGWLLGGIALGGLLALGFAAVFVVGVRLFPDPPTDARGREGGERRRRAEIRRYLASIGEPYLEDHVVAGRPADFYLPDRDVVITFDAHDYFRFERAGVRAVLLEYELPGANLGSRLPFETPEPEPDAGGHRGRRESPRWRRRWTGRDGVRRDDVEPSRESALAALGLSASATEDDVRAAYRERVKSVHPDHGGDIESFRRLREAYTVARDRAR